MAKRSTLKSMEELYRDVDRVWDCPSCLTPLAVTSAGPICPRCGEMQKRLLSVEEAMQILKMALELFPKRLHLDAEGRVLEELVDSMDLVRLWKAMGLIHAITSRKRQGNGKEVP